MNAVLLGPTMGLYNIARASLDTPLTQFLWSSVVIPIIKSSRWTIAVDNVHRLPQRHANAPAPLARTRLLEATCNEQAVLIY